MYQLSIDTSIGILTMFVDFFQKILLLKCEPTCKQDNYTMGRNAMLIFKRRIGKLSRFKIGYNATTPITKLN